MGFAEYMPRLTAGYQCGAREATLQKDIPWRWPFVQFASYWKKVTKKVAKV